MLLAFPLAAAWLLWPAGEGHSRIGRWMVQGLCALGLALPLAAVMCDYAGGLSPDGWPAVLESAWERFSLIWPTAFDLLPPGVAGLLGGGLGAIGTPQMFGHYPHHFHPADSLAVYLLVDFGLAGALYYLLPALTLRVATAGLPEQVARVYAAVLVIAYGYGTSISMFEETFFATTLGIALGAAISGRGTALRSA
ncbi:hypothetical protein EZ216_13940 [Ramlibacter humi]|uniref:O-antigen ligase domain-containing protein n=2 Tax=Ramlibacter humi TaxID=2530451 RepID=A0A4Z0BN52_9BURK|nr:hypothetical protein EZ216_13940 [Ramlibacter humi]